MAPSVRIRPELLHLAGDDGWPLCRNYSHGTVVEQSDLDLVSVPAQGMRALLCVECSLRQRSSW